MHHWINPPAPALLDCPGGKSDPCLVWAIVQDPVNPTQALVSNPKSNVWTVRVNSDRLRFVNDDTLAFAQLVPQRIVVSPEAFDAFVQALNDEEVE
jgi:hypothetical protein